MRLLPDDSVPLVVTSPPFGSIREYGGHPFYFRPMARELLRVVDAGGVVCWHVQDQIADCAESGESYRQVLYFLELGFRLHTTLAIDARAGGRFAFRYGQAIQHLFVFSKGRPDVFEPIRDVPNGDAGKLRVFRDRDADGRRSAPRTVRISEYRKRGTVWTYRRNRSSDGAAKVHPATMPEALARDVIRTWSRPGQLVLDPMSGSGTTAKAASLEGRRYLGFEVNREYHDFAAGRLEAANGLSASRRSGGRTNDGGPTP
ncbi:DNA-methyltransferase [Alienimonas sp. DA493]|uniref:DNA-methyltransferase n=1 Tax=Alienimonas sp. DA493 TaxID=3373605 RepID=UPI003754C0D1